MTKPDVTLEGLRQYADEIHLVWSEYVDEEVSDAAHNAYAALDILQGVIVDFIG